MPTVIDALVVELGLDSSKWSTERRKVDVETKKTKETLVKGGKEIEASTKKGVEMFAALRREVVALMTVFTAGVGITQFVRQIVEGDAATERMAKQLNVATSELSAWQGVMRRNGGTNADAANAIGSITTAYQEFITTGRVAMPYLSLLASYGVTFADFKDPSTALLKIADAMSKMDPARAALIGKSFGWSTETIALMSKGSAAVQKMLDEQRAIGGATEESAQQAQRLQNAWSGLLQQSTNLGRSLFVWLAPALEKASVWAKKLADWASNNAPMVQGAFIALAAAAIALSVALAAPLAPFIAIAAAAAIVGAGFAKLVSENPELLEALGEVWTSVKQLFGALSALGKWVASTPLGKWLADMFRPAGPIVTWLTNQIRGLGSALRVLSAVLRGDWKAAAAAAKDYVTDIRAAYGAGAPRPVPVRPPARSPSAATGGRGGGADPVSSGNASQLTEYLKSQGLTHEQARGVTAGAVAESRLNPNAVNPTSGAFGIGQWLGSRKQELFRRYGRNPTMQQQMEFLAWELKGGDHGGKHVLGAGSSQEALHAYITKFMRPAPGAETNGDLARGSAFLAANQNSRPPAPPASRGMAATAPSRAAQIMAAGPGTNIRIDKIDVHTKATDAKGIARDIGPAIRERTFVTQANRGLA